MSLVILILLLSCHHEKENVALSEISQHGLVPIWVMLTLANKTQSKAEIDGVSVYLWKIQLT